MTSRKNCVICDKSESASGVTEKIILFTIESLQKCYDIQDEHHRCGSVYKDIVLPWDITADSGYHEKCYQNFVTLPSSSGPIQRAQSISSENVCFDHNQQEGQISDTESSAEEVCFFCNKARKIISKKNQKLHRTENSSWIDQIKDAAEIMEDDYVFDRIISLTSNNEKIIYHNYCKLMYIQSSKKGNDETFFHPNRQLHSQVFEEICDFVEKNVCDLGNCYYIHFLTSIYRESFQKNFDASDEIPKKIITNSSLIDQLKSYFNKRINILDETRGPMRMVAPKDVKIDKLLNSALTESEILKKSALILRNHILSINKKPLPSKITLNDLITGECPDIPVEVLDFVQSLIYCHDQRIINSKKSQQKINSLAQDLIYATHNGKIKTSKHIRLGITLKSITSSRKVVDVINRYGHCCSYNVIEELETESSYSVTDNSKLCPEEIIHDSQLFTGLAFDNFDRFVETCNGHDTLHDTVAIAYQNVEIDRSLLDTLNKNNINNDSPIDFNAGGSNCSIYSDISNSNNMIMTDLNSSNNKRRRAYIAKERQIASYTKRPRLVDYLLPVDSEFRLIKPENLNFIKQIDNLWVLCHYFQVPNTPMWVGFNNLITNDESVRQKISYLPPINASPTSSSVVFQTLMDTLKIADECKQKYIQVTFDLAIAKIALQIQSSSNHVFDRIFIHLGPFHIMMAFFKALGKFIADCGLTDIMVDSELLANGSVNGFITGKHFNRCKTLHPKVSLALQMLHFERFLLRTNKTIDDEILTEIKAFKEKKLSSNCINNDKLADFLLEYMECQNDTLAGKFGKTAQFYMFYIEFVQYYLLLSRSIRTGDFEIFKYVLPLITNLFFMFNQMNYSRWLVRYHDNLIQVQNTHPGLETVFKFGYFGVKRTDKSFSRQPVDLVLEQTYNADAGRRHTGITHFTNNIFARLRWAVSHGNRSTITSDVYKELGMSRAQDITSDLQKSKISKSSLQIKNFTHAIQQNMDPFDPDLDQDILYNISTGRAASPETSNFLLNCRENGNKLRLDFISETFKSKERFEKPIKMNKILNFSSSHEKHKVKANINNKILEIRLQRDLFGRMLAISMENNIDVGQILKYPLTPVPMSLCKLDGSICATTKSILTKELEKHVESHSDLSDNVDIIIIDGFYFLYSFNNSVLPKTFGDTSRFILARIMELKAKRIDIIFDRYFSPSIKDYERSKRNSENRAYTIAGPDQARPNDFRGELKNIKFKEALVSFLILHWGDNSMQDLISNKTLKVNYDKCYNYIVKDGVVERTYDDVFTCNYHEEADTKIVYHACNIDLTANIIIKCSDTDVLIIMLGNMKNMKSQSSIWIETGNQNNHRFIHVSSLHNKLLDLGEKLCLALPAFHALTGCDQNPAFHGKGKAKPLRLLIDSFEYQDALSKLGEETCDRDYVFKITEKYVCGIYGRETIHGVDCARLCLFNKIYKTFNVNEVFQKKSLRSIDAASMPPCHSELFQHLLRTNYIACLWRNAFKDEPIKLQPANYGWKITDENQYDFKWFDGSQMPATIDEIMLKATIDEDTIQEEKGEEQQKDNDMFVRESDSESDSDSDESTYHFSDEND